MKRARPRLLPLALFTLLIFASFFCGCVSEPEVSVSSPDAPFEDEGIHAGPADQTPRTEGEQMALQYNLFALDMYRELAGGGENLFFSPWSLNSALSITYEGARGQTAEEIRSVIHLGGNDSYRRQSFSGLDQRISARDSGYILSTANALWADEGFPLSAEYRDLVEESYHARSMNLNFQEESEEARATINAWVQERTKGKIMDLIPAGHIDPLTRLVLTNAIYFKGSWENEFDPELTEDEDFSAANGGTVAVPMMMKIGDEARFPYLEKDDLQILKMPYQGENVSLLILLPKNNDLDSLEGAISAEKLRQWREELMEQRVDIYIPRFKFSAKYFLNENLTRMGMPTAFSETADFSGISPRSGLFISFVIHQAFVEVNEEGTEAAAATAVGVEEGAEAVVEEEIPVFRADHPFIFMIIDDQTGLILFMGRFSQPEES